jgi:hypothetical protein
MSYRPVFDNDCFGANSTLFIPTFKSLRKPTSNNSEATSRELGSKGLDEREAREKLRARKEELRKLTDDDDVIKYDKYHAANLISRASPAMPDRDVVTVAAHAPPHTTPPSELNQNQRGSQDNGRERREERTQVGVEGNETGKNETRKHERVAGEVETAAGEHPPHIETHGERHDEHDNEVGTHELVCGTTLAVELPPNHAASGEYNPPPPPPDPPPRTRAEKLAHDAAPVSPHPLALTITPHAAISTPTPTLSPSEAPSYIANRSRDRAATQPTRAITRGATDGLPRRTAHCLPPHILATRITRLRPPPWPNDCRRHCQTPSYRIPYILHLRPLPWPPPLAIFKWSLNAIARTRYLP